MMRHTGERGGKKFHTVKGGVHWWKLLVVCLPVITGCAIGQYRMPYGNGTLVLVAQDHNSHSSPTASMYDLVAQNMLPAEVVAAADGIVRFKDDTNAEPTNDNNYVWIEHPQYSYMDDGQVFTEWTVYAHLATGSVTGTAGLSVGDPVSAGDFLGFESNVGFSSPDGFVHLHWNVFAVPPGVIPTFNGYYLEYVTDTGIKPERIPVVCVQGGPDVLEKNLTYTAAGCAGARVLSSKVLRHTIDRAGNHLQKGSPVALIFRKFSQVSEEALAIAMANPDLMGRTQDLLLRLTPAYDDLRELGVARITTDQLVAIRRILSEYQELGSPRLNAAIEPLLLTLATPRGPESLGLVVVDPFDVLD